MFRQKIEIHTRGVGLPIQKPRKVGQTQENQLGAAFRPHWQNFESGSNGIDETEPHPAKGDSHMTSTEAGRGIDIIPSLQTSTDMAFLWMEDLILFSFNHFIHLHQILRKKPLSGSSPSLLFAWAGCRDC
jgi:hypothetical protein